MRYDISMGCHPYAIGGESALVEGQGLNPPDGNPKVHEQWQSDPRGTICGHNVARDDGILSILEVDGEVPLSPLFVKDLAGRTIYIGYGPEQKTLDAWNAYQATATDDEGRPKNPWIGLVTFPRLCQLVTEAMGGYDLLENVFLTRFRNLDMGRTYAGRPSGGEENEVVQGFYASANLYPYKYRPDTFYVDGALSGRRSRTSCRPATARPGQKSVRLKFLSTTLMPLQASKVGITVQPCRNRSSM